MASKILSSSLSVDYPALVKVQVARLSSLPLLDPHSLAEPTQPISQSEEITLSLSCFLHSLFPAEGCPTFGKVSNLCSHAPPLSFSEEMYVHIGVAQSQIHWSSLEKALYYLLANCVVSDGIANSHSTKALAGEFGAKIHTIYAGYAGHQAVLRSTCNLTPQASDNSLTGFHYSLATLLRNSLSAEVTTLGNNPLLNAVVSLESAPKFSWCASDSLPITPTAFSFFSKPSPIARLADLEAIYNSKVKELALTLVAGAGKSISSVVDQSFVDVMKNPVGVVGPKLPLFSFSFVPALILTSSPPVLQLVIYVVIKPRYLVPSLSSDARFCASLLASLHSTGAFINSPQFVIFRDDAVRLGLELRAKQLELKGTDQGFLKFPSFQA